MKIHPTNKLRQLILILACAAFALGTTACTSARGSFSRTLHVNGPVILRVATGSGDIHVMPGDPSSVQVTGHVHAFGLFHTMARVHRIELHPPIQQSGNNIQIGGNTPHGVAIDYNVIVPSSAQLTVSTGSGDLRILNISGSTTASTGSGDIHATGLGGHVILRTGSGDIHAGFNNANDINISTGTGDIILKHAQGILTARTGTGDVHVSGTPSGGWNIKTGTGDVTLHTGSAQYSLTATTGSGGIHSSQPMTTHGNISHHHIQADINGGGPSVQITTGSGDINIH